LYNFQFDYVPDFFMNLKLYLYGYGLLLLSHCHIASFITNPLEYLVIMLRSKDTKENSLFPSWTL